MESTQAEIEQLKALAQEVFRFPSPLALTRWFNEPLLFSKSPLELIFAGQGAHLRAYLQQKK